VWVVSEEILGREPREVRRSLLLISDGVDTSSRMKLAEAVRAALRAEVVVYAVGIGDDKNFDGVDRDDLRKLTEPTGGRAFFPKKADELPAIFTQIQNELLSPYVVTFAAPDARRDGSFRKLKIEVVNPELRRRGVKVSHPQGYVDGDPPARGK
jgi:Ca-activated chloride channel family protein